MAYEMLMAAHVADPNLYDEYRAAMMPLLSAAGGAFRFDCKVEQVLKGDVPEGVNRVFVIRFPSRKAKEDFFADAAYGELRAKLLTPAVRAMAVIAEYELPGQEE